METVLEQRWRRLQSPVLGIDKPAARISYAPFDEPKYTHRAKLNLNRPPWVFLLDEEPKKLLSADPFAKSKYRDGLAVWDSAALPQSSAAEQTGMILNEKVDRLGFENPRLQELETIFGNMVGVNEYDQPVRPQGMHIFDLTRMGQIGWMFIEAAHALAHLRCDHMHDSPAFRPVIQKSMCMALASLLHGCAFGGQVYVGRENAFGTALAQPSTGFAVSDITNPVLQIRKTGWGSLVPDSAAIIALWLYHVEPAPESYVAKTVTRGINDEWSGIPTIMAFVGWDGVDSILHARTKSTGNSEYYVMHAGDLIPPGKLVEALPLDIPKPGRDWVDPIDWIHSKDFLELVSNTPSLPCKDCYMINPKTPGAPKRPQTGSKRAWDAYEKERNECIAIADKAAEKREIESYAAFDMTRPRRDARKRNNVKRRKAFDQQAAREKKIEKIKAKVSGKISAPLTEKEQELYKTMKKEEKK